MAKDRKARKKASKQLDTTKPLMPIDILAFGTEDDPCFGKHHDMNDDTCKRCGDSSICQIASNQTTELLRAEQEKGNRFKDLELTQTTPDKKAIKKVIKAKLKKGTISLLIQKQIMKDFKLDKETAKKLIKKVKG